MYNGHHISMKLRRLYGDYRSCNIFTCIRLKQPIATSPFFLLASHNLFRTCNSDRIEHIHGGRRISAHYIQIAPTLRSFSALSHDYSDFFLATNFAVTKLIPKLCYSYRNKSHAFHIFSSFRHHKDHFFLKCDHF